MHSDNTLLANARAMVEDWQHDERTVLLSLSPLSHHIATVALAQMLAAGMELVVNAPPPGMTPLDWIIETGATYVMGVPTHAMDILGEMRRRGLDRLGAVKTFYMAGSPIPREVAQAFLDRGVTAAERLWHEREQLAPIHPARRRPGDHRRDLRPACRAYEIRLFDQENPDIEVAAGRDRRDRRPRRLPDARLFRQPAGDRGVVQPRAAGSCAAISAGSTRRAISRSSAARRT